MWLTKLWWLFDFIFRSLVFAFCLFFILFGEVLFFANLLDVYSYYVFDTPTLFACLVTSVDEELRCFFNRRLWWQGNSVTLFDAYPRAEFKSDVLGGKKGYFVKDWVFNVMANSHLSLLLGFDESETVHPPHFLQGGCVFFFLILCCNSHHLMLCCLIKSTFLCVRFSSETYYCLFCTEYLSISPSSCGISRTVSCCAPEYCAASRCK